MYGPDVRPWQGAAITILPVVAQTVRSMQYGGAYGPYPPIIVQGARPWTLPWWTISEDPRRYSIGKIRLCSFEVVSRNPCK